MSRIDTETLKNNLNRTDNIELVIKAMEKVIVSSTIGHNLSELYHDILKLLYIDNLKLKKLVYLYIIVYSIKNEKDAIMLINQFIKDCKDKRNLVKCSAIKTLGYLGIKQLNEYLIDILKDNLNHSDGYVKKNSILALLKVSRISPELIKEKKIITTLEELLKNDNLKNWILVGNGLRLLYNIKNNFDSNNNIKTESDDLNTSNLLDFNIPENNNNNLEDKSFDFDNFINDLKSKHTNNDSIAKLEFPNEYTENILKALNNSTSFEYQSLVSILCKFEPPKCLKNVKKIIDILYVKLNTTSPSIIITNSKLIIMYLYKRYFNNFKTQNYYLEKIVNKIQNNIGAGPKGYLMIKNIESLIYIFHNVNNYIEYSKVVISDNDPINVRLLKLKLLCKISNKDNYGIILQELSEYKKDLNIIFSQKSIKYYTKVLIKMVQSSKNISNIKLFVQAYLEFTNLSVNNKNFIILEEIVNSIKDILENNPAINSELKDFYSIINCNYNRIISLQAKKSLLYIFSVRFNYFNNKSEILDYVKNRFLQEGPDIQIEIIQCFVKLYLDKVDDSENLLNELLELIDNKIENPGVREAAYMYWRLLENDPEACKDLINYSNNIKDISNVDYNNYNNLIVFKYRNNLEDIINEFGTVNAFFEYYKKGVKKIKNNKETEDNLIYNTVDQDKINEYYSEFLSKDNNSNNIKDTIQERDNNTNDSNNKISKNKNNLNFIKPKYQEIITANKLTNKNNDIKLSVQSKLILNSIKITNCFKLKLKNNSDNIIIIKGLSIKENIFCINVKEGYKFIKTKILPAETISLVIPVSANEDIDDSIETYDIALKFKLEKDFVEGNYITNINTFFIKELKTKEITKDFSNIKNYNFTISDNFSFPNFEIILKNNFIFKLIDNIYISEIKDLGLFRFDVSLVSKSNKEHDITVDFLNDNNSDNTSEQDNKIEVTVYSDLVIPESLRLLLEDMILMANNN